MTAKKSSLKTKNTTISRIGADFFPNRLSSCVFLILSLLLIHSSAVAQKPLSYSDKTYEPQIKTVQLVGPYLEFDDLSNQRNTYYAKVIHCNYDWTKSTLSNLDFMQDYNEFNITDYAFSSGTHIDYVHYRFPLPEVKLPGNYLLIVYRDGNEKDLILSKRFFKSENRVTLVSDNQRFGGGALRSSNQQLNFTLNYGGVEIINPLGSVHVVIRQNQRWDNARMDVQPSFVRESERQLEYRFTDQDNQFNAGNEFRFVDFRSLIYPGQNTGKMDRSTKPYQLSVQSDQSREFAAYAQYRDMNGSYVIENLDNREAVISGNYLNVTFTLNTSRQINGNVYVAGAFNNWDRNKDNLMKFNPDQSAYQATMLLKQGRYDYQFLVNDKQLSLNYFEGDHFETENIYEVLVYYKPFRPNADLLIGYFVIPVNPR